MEHDNKDFLRCIEKAGVDRLAVLIGLNLAESSGGQFIQPRPSGDSSRPFVDAVPRHLLGSRFRGALPLREK